LTPSGLALAVIGTINDIKKGCGPAVVVKGASIFWLHEDSLLASRFNLIEFEMLQQLGKLATIVIWNSSYCSRVPFPFSQR
jgi:hypothetical protein